MPAVTVVWPSDGLLGSFAEVSESLGSLERVLESSDAPGKCAMGISVIGTQASNHGCLGVCGVTPSLLAPISVAREVSSGDRPFGKRPGRCHLELIHKRWETVLLCFLISRIGVLRSATVRFPRLVQYQSRLEIPPKPTQHTQPSSSD